MPRALRPVNTPGLRSSASLRFATSADHLRLSVDADLRPGADLRREAEAVLRAAIFIVRFRFANFRFAMS